MKNKCIIICNGPSVERFSDFIKNTDINNYDIIAVNIWKDIFNQLNIKDPDVIIVGKNSLQYNLPYIKYCPQINFIGIDSINKPNYSCLKFGKIKCYDKIINFIPSLWWSGTYAIQYALQSEYDEIHIFGYTCTNDNDYKNNMIRASIHPVNLLRIVNFFKEIKSKHIIDHLIFYENKDTHTLKNIIF